MRSKLAVFAGASILCASLSAAAIATGNGGGGSGHGQISACLRSDGLLVKVAVGDRPASSCSNGERTLTWNVRGPSGPKGDQGPRGDQGQKDRKSVV
jgi:hypothetical protein